MPAPRALGQTVATATGLATEAMQARRLEDLLTAKQTREQDTQTDGLFFPSSKQLSATQQKAAAAAALKTVRHRPPTCRARVAHVGPNVLSWFLSPT